MTSDGRDYYKILQVDPSAECEVVDAAYKRLALKYHPDVNRSPDAKQRMQELNLAYEILSNPARRKAYDQQRSAAAETHPPVNGTPFQTEAPGHEARRRADNVPGPPSDLPAGFRAALNVLNQSGRSVFVTGKAGTGKSTLLRLFSDSCGKRHVLLAPTGIAALNIHGVTIHSFFRFPPSWVTDTDVRQAADRGLYSSLDVIVIDEASMVRADLLDVIDKFMRVNGRDPSKPFGGTQVIFFGDLFQLPPVVKTEEENEFLQSRYKSEYFIHACALTGSTMQIVELRKPFRHSDPSFVELLDAARTDVISDAQIAHLNSRLIPGYLPTPGDASIVLTTTNQRARELNERQLSAINSPSFEYHGRLEGHFPKDTLPTEMTLCLKAGAQVMFVKNDASRRWVNGTIGRVVYASRDQIEVEVCANGAPGVYPVFPERWEIFKYRFDRSTEGVAKDVVGAFTQYPLKLAWAVTIHKSQGLTFDRAVIDLERGAFACGQAYVALSRCRSLEGIILRRPLRRSDIRVHPAVVEFERSLKRRRLPHS